VLVLGREPVALGGRAGADSIPVTVRFSHGVRDSVCLPDPVGLAVRIAF
jgi:hypothetical protein